MKVALLPAALVVAGLLFHQPSAPIEIAPYTPEPIKRVAQIETKVKKKRPVGLIAREADGSNTSPEPQTAPQTSFSSGCDQYRPLLEKYDWDVQEALLVMSKESGCNPYAISPTNDHGLFQINGQPVYDPAQNIAIAYGKWGNPRLGTVPNWSAWYAVCPYGGGSPYGLRCG